MAKHMREQPRRIGAYLGLALALGAAAAPPDITNTMPLADRDAIEDAIGSTLVIPDTAIWKFNLTNSFPAGGQLYCGSLTAQDSRREYMAPQRFFAVVQDGQVTRWALYSGPATDPLGATKFQITLLCDTMK